MKLIPTSPGSVNFRAQQFQIQKSQTQQQGFTLVEIMVAIAISLLMMAGILQISAANKESSRLQRNMGFVQENIRTAVELLGRDIRKAGYYEDDNPNARIITPLTPIVATIIANNVTVTVTSDGGGAKNDEITVTYESDTDCLGRSTPTIDGNRFAVNHYFIKDERLMCGGNGSISATTGLPIAQPLVEGVENMQILYGVNTSGDSGSANSYVQPGGIDLSQVVSVRIAMRFHSREHVRQGVDKNSYALLDALPTKPAAGDRRIRREVTTTISLRN